VLWKILQAVPDPSVASDPSLGSVPSSLQSRPIEALVLCP